MYMNMLRECNIVVVNCGMYVFNPELSLLGQQVHCITNSASNLIRYL